MSDQNRPGNEPNLATYGAELIRVVMTQLNAHHLGQVDTFDETKQSASAKIGYKKTLGDGSTADYPPIVDAPVLFLGGGGGALTFAVEKGDDCMVLFNDRNMDNWITAGQVAVADVERLHGFPDALVIVGFRPFCRALADFFTGGAELSQGSTKIQLTDKVRIMNATTDLKTLLNSFVDTVSTIVGQLTPTTGMTGANIAANQAALTAFKVQLGGLLT